MWDFEGTGNRQELGALSAKPRRIKMVSKGNDFQRGFAASRSPFDFNPNPAAL
jgi:hypothetical protein